MSEHTRRNLAVLLAAFCTAVAARALAVTLLDRLDVALSLAALGLAVVVLEQLGFARFAPRAEWQLIPIGALVLALVWRDSQTLYALNLAAIATGLLLLAPKTRAPRLGRAGTTDLLRGLVQGALGVAAGAALPLARVDRREVPLGAVPRGVRGAGLGALAAAPALVVFGALLRSADPIYDRLVGRVLDVNVATAAQHAVAIGVWTWLFAGLLAATVAAPVAPLVRRARSGRLGFAEVGTALGLVALLFLSFLLVQARYLFGGAELVRRTVGLTLAEYARSGFFELVWVVTLALPLLLAAEWAVDAEDRAAVRRVRRLAAAIVAMLVVLLVSALARMKLYTDAYGLTETRLYTTAFMGWVAVVLGWFCATVLRGRRRRFASGGLAAGVVTLLVLNLANPDAVIARVNAGRVGGEARADVRYAATLGADAIPALVARLGALPAAERCGLARALGEWHDRARRATRWTTSLAAARRRLDAAQAELGAACEGVGAAVPGKAAPREAERGEAARGAVAGEAVAERSAASAADRARGGAVHAPAM
jgi:hypothetical protein